MAYGDLAWYELMTRDADAAKRFRGEVVGVEIERLAVEDVDAATEWVKESGGRVHEEPAHIGEYGTVSIVVDPDGAVFLLFTPKGTPPGESAGKSSIRCSR